MAQKTSNPTVISAAAIEEINSICLEFCTRYYGAIQAIPDAWSLERFYNHTSKHIHLRFGQQPEEVLGLDEIVPFVKRMKFDQCNFAINSISAKRPWPTRFTVFIVGELSHPGRIASRKFTQSMVFLKFPPSKSSTRRQYLILKTVFKFIDRVNDDQFFPAFNGPKKVGPAAMTGVPKESAGKSSPAVEKTAIAVNIASDSGEKRSTSDKNAETPGGQSAVPINTTTLEPIREERSNNVVQTPDEKTTAPKTPCKNTGQLNASAEQAKQKGNKSTKPPQKKTKTKYVNFCEFAERKSPTTDVAEVDKSLKNREKAIDNNAKVDFWRTRLSFTGIDPSTILNVTPKGELATTSRNHKSIVPEIPKNVSGEKPVAKTTVENIKVQSTEAQNAKQAVQNQTEQPCADADTNPSIVPEIPKNVSGEKPVAKTTVENIKVLSTKAQKAKQAIQNQTKQPCADADTDPTADGWQIKQSRKKKTQLPRVMETETAKDQSTGRRKKKQNKKPVSDFKETPKTLEPGVLKNKLVFLHPVKGKETPKSS